MRLRELYHAWQIAEPVDVAVLAIFAVSWGWVLFASARAVWESLCRRSLSDCDRDLAVRRADNWLNEGGVR